MIKLKDLLTEMKYVRIKGEKGLEAVTEKGTKFLIYPSVERERVTDKRSGRMVDREKPIWKAVMYDERGNISPKFYDVKSRSLSGIKSLVERYARNKGL